MLAATAMITITPLTATCLPVAALAQDAPAAAPAPAPGATPPAATPPDSTPASTTSPDSTAAPASTTSPDSTAAPDTAPESDGASAPDQSAISGRISVIDITGNKNISSTAIRAIVRQKVGDDYNPNSAEADRQAIQDMGYFGAVTERAAAGPNPGDVVVTYTMIENPRVTRIVFTGNTVESTAKLMAVVMTKPGQVLDTNTLAQDTQNIIGVYSQDGYRASISEDINLDYTTGVLTLPIIEAKVSSLTITGNKRTKPYVILRELKTHVGSPYNEVQLRRDLTRLNNLGLFDSVGPVDVNTPDVGLVALSIPVKEKQTGQVSVSVGYSTQEKLIGTATLSDSNFRGRGETASIMWQVAGVDGQASAEAGFGDPFIDKRHDGFNIDLYNRAVFRFSSSFIDTSTSGSTDQYYERHIGGTLTLSRPVSDTSTLFLTGRTETVRSNNVSLPIEDSFIRQDDDVSGLGVRYVNNTRDNEFSPAAGGYYSISAEGVTSTDSTQGNAPTPLTPGSHEFPKFGIDLRRYISLQGPRRKSFNEPKRVLAFRLLGGITSAQIPFSEEYFLGGAESLRGYEDDRFWGNKLLLLNSEVRVPLGNSLTGVVFGDVGDAWGSIYQGLGLQQHTQFQPQPAVGVGVRVTTPIGPIRIDYGVGRDGGRTDFSIGQSF